jgi:hypothetical protein
MLGSQSGLFLSSVFSYTYMIHQFYLSHSFSELNVLESLMVLSLPRPVWIQ